MIVRSEEQIEECLVTGLNQTRYTEPKNCFSTIFTGECFGKNELI